MKHAKTLARAATVAGALLCGTQSFAADLHLSCDETDNLDASMTARYIHTPTRALFDVSFKAPQSTSLQAREVLEVRVNGEVVGLVGIAPRGNDKYGASLSFDSYANNGSAGSSPATPFAASWPGALPPNSGGIPAGTRVMVGSLGCALK